MGAQKREFVVDGGEMVYESGKNETQTIKMYDIVKVEAVNPDRLEFSFKVKQGREYYFRSQLVESALHPVCDSATSASLDELRARGSLLSTWAKCV